MESFLISQERGGIVDSVFCILYVQSDMQLRICYLQCVDNIKSHIANPIVNTEYRIQNCQNPFLPHF